MKEECHQIFLMKWITLSPILTTLVPSKQWMEESIGVKRIQLSSPASFLGGAGRLRITSWASWDLLMITSFSFTAVCILLTFLLSLLTTKVSQYLILNVIYIYMLKRPRDGPKALKGKLVFLFIYFSLYSPAHGLKLKRIYLSIYIYINIYSVVTSLCHIKYYWIDKKVVADMLCWVGLGWVEVNNG